MADGRIDRQLVLEVRRDDWGHHRIVDAPLRDDLGAGRVRLRVDRFALTSNNVTYAVTGDLLGYWKFFPADDGWGRIPVMGFADVVASRHPEVREGERVFGFFPMATHLDVEATEAGGGHFLDGAAHRRDTALAYRQYLRTTADPLHRIEHEDALMLLRGLFLTSFLVDDFLAAASDFGASTFVLSSASSKTAIALAHRLSRRGAGRVIGLTSAQHRDFVGALGCFDRVVPYSEIATIESDAPAVFVDHAGNGAVVSAVHAHLADRLRHSCIVGATHWNAKPRAGALPGPEPTFFFAPAQIERRTREWGPAGVQQKLGEAWEVFRAGASAWLEIERRRGPAAVVQCYEENLGGRVPPHVGRILSMWGGGT